MALLENGILGGFSGKVGNIVGFRIKNRCYIRKMPAKSSKPPTVKQLAQRAKFALGQVFLSQLRALLKPLPERGAKHISAFNSCFSQVIRAAVAGTYPEFAIDYSAVRLTAGSLYNGCRHFVSADQTRLTFSWCPGMYNCRFEGTAVLLAYNPEKEQWIYNSSNAGSEDRWAELYLPCNFKGDRVETYLYFISADGKKVSDSVYTGSVDIPAAFICGQMINLN